MGWVGDCAILNCAVISPLSQQKQTEYSTYFYSGSTIAAECILPTDDMNLSQRNWHSEFDDAQHSI